MNKDCFSFVVYMIHACADGWNTSPANVYGAIKKSGCLDEYLIPCYDVLHTQSTDYVVHDTGEYLKKRDVAVNAHQGAMNDDVLEKYYQEGLEERLIAYLAKENNILLEQAMDIYYRSNMAKQIYEGTYGVQYLDYKVLAKMLMETEPGLFAKNNNILDAENANDRVETGTDDKEGKNDTF